MSHYAVHITGTYCDVPESGTMIDIPEVVTEDLLALIGDLLLLAEVAGLDCTEVVSAAEALADQERLNDAIEGLEQDHNEAG